MRLVKIELKKLARSPYLWILWGFFAMFNLFLVYEYVGQYKSEYQDMHTVIENSIEERRPAANESDNIKELTQAYNEYYNTNKKLYSNLDMKAVLEKKEKISDYHPQGLLKKMINNNYSKLQQRVESIKETKEGDFGFYPGNIYRVHSFLYNKIGRKMLLEIVLLVMISMLYIMDYERISKTRDVTISTRIGKKEMTAKIISGFIYSVVLSILLGIITYTAFFSAVNMKALWNVPMTSVVLAEQHMIGFFYPFITYVRMSFGQYFIATMGLYFVIAATVAFLTMSIQLLIQNSYFSFTIEVVMYAAMSLMVFIQNGTILDLLLLLINPVSLYFTSGGWFMENDPCLSFAGNELAILAGTLAWISVILFWGIKRYKKLEII